MDYKIIIDYKTNGISDTLKLKKKMCLNISKMLSAI